LTAGDDGVLHGATNAGGDLTCVTGGPFPGCGTVFQLVARQ
jgi:hypothetical protein